MGQTPRYQPPISDIIEIFLYALQALALMQVPSYQATEVRRSQRSPQTSETRRRRRRGVSIGALRAEAQLDPQSHATRGLVATRCTGSGPGVEGGYAFGPTSSPTASARGGSRDATRSPRAATRRRRAGTCRAEARGGGIFPPSGGAAPASGVHRAAPSSPSPCLRTYRSYSPRGAVASGLRTAGHAVRSILLGPRRDSQSHIITRG